MREAWLKSEFFRQSSGHHAGRLDLTNYFDRNAVANDETRQFLSDALVNNPTLGLISNGAGVAMVYDPKRTVNFKIGFQQNDTQYSESFTIDCLAGGSRHPCIGPFPAGRKLSVLGPVTDNTRGWPQKCDRFEL